METEETKKTNPKKEDVLAKDKKELTPEQANQEKLTIMPTMIDESEEITIKRRDLSAIIPKNNTPVFEQPQDNSIELVSKENILKSDGSVTIANIDENGEAIMKGNFAYPEQIDIEQRKEEKNKVQKKKKVKLKPSAAAQRFQNRSALMALVVIILLGAFYWYEKNKPTEADFTPLTVKIEAGDSLPIRASKYVSPGIGTEVDELLYYIDKSQIIIDEVGEYPFTVTYKGITKTGKVIIQDTTKPLLKVKEVIIEEGETFEAASFVESCIDWSGCTYMFAQSTAKQEYTEPGAHNVTIIATDAFQNYENKTASLIIEPKGNLKTYTKETGYNFDTGYSLNESYQIRYYERSGVATLISGKYTQIFTYQDEDKYKKARETYTGEVNYKCDDHNMTITHVETVSTVGSNYSIKTDIEAYLTNNGFK